MPHDLESANGTTFFADSRADAWHQLGQQVGRSMTVHEAMTYSHLGNWDVRKMPLIIPAEYDETLKRVRPDIAVDGKFAVVRTNPVTGERNYLGVVGNDYTPIQNEANAEFLQTVADEFGAPIETAGSLGGGRDVFITMKLPRTLEITGVDGAVDTTEYYLAALNNHNGTKAFRLILTPTRIVCRNTQQWALRNAKSVWSVRHTENATTRVQLARESLGITMASMDAVDAEFQRMASTEFDEVEARKFTDALMQLDEVDPTSQAATQRRGRSDAIFNLFDSSPTIKNIAGTKYAMYNAVTEYVDWFANVRGAGSNASESAKQALRAQRTIRDLDNPSSLKVKAFSMLASV